MTDPLAAAVKAHSEARTARRDLDEASTRRASAIRLALDSGIPPQEIADALNVRRPRVYAMLNQGKKP